MDVGRCTVVGAAVVAGLVGGTVAPTIVVDLITRPVPGLEPFPVRAEPEEGRTVETNRAPATVVSVGDADGSSIGVVRTSGFVVVDGGLVDDDGNVVLLMAI